MNEKIIELYYTLVKNDRREIENVPENIRGDVQALLDADENVD
ncbi:MULTISPECIES: CD1375 family protein [Brevibacillus]|jgi:hypothetical protein|nr:CD1375 family protein [Brevibacillus borstelensis]MED1881266.1 CD1375 family protein [Brevibacillus borstelensis]GED55412.1 hypothetical protein BBO01nite_46530 [Brevibacillus borstelensis]